MTADHNHHGRACRTCGGRLAVVREIVPPRYPPLNPDHWWSIKDDASVCDTCFDRIQREQRAKEFRKKRKTERRWTCSKCATKFWAPRGNGRPPYCYQCSRTWATCPECKGEFNTNFGRYSHCSTDCVEVSDIRERLAEWDASLPRTYRSTQLEKLPDRESAEKVLDWSTPHPSFPDLLPGLFAFGPSGSGKTRSALLFLRETISGGETVRYLRSAEFAREVIERTKPGGTGGLAGFITGLRKVDVLCLDEVEKLKFSERVEAEFFDLVEGRLADHRALMFFGNVDPKAISDRMSEAYAGPFFRRIMEFCQAVHFRLPERRKPRA